MMKMASLLLQRRSKPLGNLASLARIHFQQMLSPQKAELGDGFGIDWLTNPSFQEKYLGEEMVILAYLLSTRLHQWVMEEILFLTVPC